MGKGIDQGSVPPDDPMFSGAPQLHSPMPASELTRPTRPSHLMERLVELEMEYEKRFAHRIPLAVLQSRVISELNYMLEGSLKNGEPIEGWAEQCVQQELDQPDDDWFCA